MVEGQRNGKFSLNGKLGPSCASVTKGRPFKSRFRDRVGYLDINVSRSSHNCAYVVDGSSTFGHAPS